MFRWYALAGLALWLAGTVVAVVATYDDIRTTPVRLRLADGTTVRGVLYRTRSAPDPAPAAVVLHGTALAHASCAPGLAIPLARIGVVVLAVDLLGHGASGGTLPRSEYDDLPAMLNTPAGQPELDAALAYLRARPFVDGKRLALVGHSRGGWMAVVEGCRCEDVACVVSVSSGPTVCDRERPRNLLFLAGGLDEVISQAQYRAALARATAGEGEPGEWLGDTDRGTARQLVISPWSLHLSTLADPTTTRRAVQWVAWCLHLDPGPVPGRRLLAADLAVAVASLGALLAATALLAALARRLLPAAEGEIGAGHRPLLAVLFLLAAAASPATARLSDRLPDGGVLFSAHACALLFAVGLAAALAARGAPREISRGSPLPPGRGVLLGVLGGALTLALLGVPWGMTWLSLVPTPRRVGLTLVLLALLVPCGLALASGVQRLLGRTAPTFGGALRRGLTWLGLWLALWLGHLLLGRADRPFLGIPIRFVAASGVVPLPLWLLPDRPGLGVARAVSHALGAACFLGCHLPFVHDG